jgi:pantoate--beta-alanine ligase
VVGCDTIREPDGLAMSSRNKLMSDKERKSAKEIIKLLLWAKEVYPNLDFIQIRDEIKNRSKLIDSFKLEYFEIMNLEEFSSISKKNNETRAFIACRIGNIRLIDNIKL